MTRIAVSACLARCLARHDRVVPLWPNAIRRGHAIRAVWSWGARYVWTVFLGMALLAAPSAAGAQPVAIPATWGGEFWSRPRLSGDWGGLRDELGKKGVVLDVDLLLTPQWVTTGGRDTGAVFWGNADYTLNVDTGKLGLWPGGFLKVFADTGFGESVLDDSGATVPVNTATILPDLGEQTSALMHATFLQFLSPHFGLLAGKLFTLDANIGEFAGDYRTQFLNAGLVFPANLALVPVSAFGGGIVVLPWEGAVLSATVLDPSGSPTDNDLGDAFDDGVMVLASGKVTIKPFGLVGHQSLGGMWSNKERLSLIQDPSNLARLFLTEQFPRLQNPGPLLQRILQRFFPQLLVPVQPANREGDTWAMFYSFDQYLWHPGGDPYRGLGIFFTFGASDGDANPIKYIYSMGVGGKGVLPWRPKDSFGLGWARTDFSNNLVPFLRQRLDIGLNHEDAIEMYYNAVLASWLHATLDLQIVEPGLKKTLDASSNLVDVDTAVLAGIRLYMRF